MMDRLGGSIYDVDVTGPWGVGSDWSKPQPKQPSPPRILKVIGIGEMVLEPDTVEFVIRVDSSKESHEEANASVNKRVHYLQELAKSMHINNVTVHKSLKKDGTAFHMSAEMLMICSNLAKYETMLVTVVEKFSSVATVSEPIFSNSTKQMGNARLTTLKLAKEDAYHQAEEMVSGSSNMELGSVILMQAHSEVRNQSLEYEAQAQFKVFAFHAKRKTITTKIQVIYEMNIKNP